MSEESKACSVPLVVTSARLIVWLGDRDLTINDSAHEGFIFGLAPAGLVTDGLRREVKVLRALQKQFSDHQRARRVLPSSDRLCRRVMLHFALDRIARDRNPVDTDRDGLSGRKLHMHRA